MTKLGRFIKSMWRLHAKVERNLIIHPPLESHQDPDTIAIWLGGPLAQSKPSQFLKYVSGPDGDNIYTMQPVEKKPDGTWINAGAQVYMEG